MTTPWRGAPTSTSGQLSWLTSAAQSWHLLPATSGSTHSQPYSTWCQHALELPSWWPPSMVTSHPCSGLSNQRVRTKGRTKFWLWVRLKWKKASTVYIFFKHHPLEIDTEDSELLAKIDQANRTGHTTFVCNALKQMMVRSGQKKKLLKLTCFFSDIISRSSLPFLDIPEVSVMIAVYHRRRQISQLFLLVSPHQKRSPQAF